MSAHSSRERWHFITPTSGGVRDYAEQLATALAAAGDEVHLWTPADPDGQDRSPEGVAVHARFGRFGIADLKGVGRELDRHAAPRRILVHWVPHGYGWRSMNIPFCLWLIGRRLRGDRVEILVHEPFLAFGEGSARQDLVAAVHRPMTALLLTAASRVWVSIPAWEQMLRPYALGRRLGFEWLPMPSNVTVASGPSRDERNEGASRESGRRLIGHFGTYAPPISSMLDRVLPELLGNQPSADALLLGRGSEAFAARLVREHPELATRIVASGPLSEREISARLSGCDVMIQPYPDGVSTRRTSVMAALAHGRAVVTTSGYLTEAIWSEKGFIAIAPVSDLPAMVAEAERLLNDDERRTELGRRAAEVYQAEFDISVGMERLRSAAVAAR